MILVCKADFQYAAMFILVQMHTQTIDVRYPSRGQENWVNTPSLRDVRELLKRLFQKFIFLFEEDMNFLPHIRIFDSYDYFLIFDIST